MLISRLGVLMLSSVAATCAAIVLSTVACRSNQRGGPDQEGTGSATSTASSVCKDVVSAEAESTIAITFIRWDYSGRTPVGILELANRSDAPVFVYGEDKDFPHYMAQEMTPFGWKDMMMGWCGNGAGMYRIDAGEVVHFEFFHYQKMKHGEVKTMRVGVRISAQDRSLGESFRMEWSGAFSMGAK